ncbi:hypothetical protein Hanom_Chr16g01511561 [Helianthus anomalus]
MAGNGRWVLYIDAMVFKHEVFLRWAYWVGVGRVHGLLEISSVGFTSHLGIKKNIIYIFLKLFINSIVILFAND